MRRIPRLLAALGMVAGLVPLLPIGIAVADDAVVGTGSLASCTEAAFDVAWAAAKQNGGGTLTFNCGGAATIVFTGQKSIGAGESVVVNGAGLITIDGNLSTRLFNLSDGSLDLLNLRIVNGRSGILAGGAIYNSRGTLAVIGSSFDNNRSNNNGGAIFAIRGSLTVISSTFTGNRGKVFGGAIANDEGPLTISGSTFEANLARNGGAFFTEQGNVNIFGNTFTTNTANGGDGGAVIVGNQGTVTISNNDFIQNASTRKGGAVRTNSDVPVLISGNSFVGNTAPDGGAISNFRNVSINESVFEGNSASDDGGAVHTNGGTVAIEGSRFDDNSADNSGGGIYNDGESVVVEASSFNGNEGGSGGGAIANGGGGEVRVDASSFTGNSTGGSSPGGAIFNLTNGDLIVSNSQFIDNESGDGGAIDGSSAMTTVQSSRFIDNSAISGGDGGAISVLGGELNVDASTFSGNDADNQGGGVYTTGVTRITHSTFVDNEANGSGGAITAFVSSLFLATSTLSDNSAGSDGGGLYAASIPSVEVVDSTVAENEATGAGGGIAFGGNVGSGTLRNTIVADNLATDCSGSVTSLGYNLDSDGTCTSQPTDIPSGNASLGPLASNGGPTLTHLPLAGSAAIDDGGGCSGTDQRGLPRPSGSACDIGSVELQTAPTYTLCAHYFTGQVFSPFSGQCGAYQIELTFPPFSSYTFCTNPWNGALLYSFTGNCGIGYVTHVIPTDRNLFTCVAVFTGLNRSVGSFGACTAGEVPNIIPDGS